MGYCVINLVTNNEIFKKISELETNAKIDDKIAGFQVFLKGIKE